MQVQYPEVDLGNPLIVEIIKLAHKGMSDRQIGRVLCKHYKTIAYHRKKHGIAAGRSHKAALTKSLRTKTTHKRSYKMIVYNGKDKEQIPGTKLKHGLNAYSPIMCRAENCPYIKTCSVPNYDLAVGEACIIEVAIITSLREKYIQELGIIEDDFVAIAKIRHLIDIEIKLIRCNRLVAVNPELVHTIWENEQPKKLLNPVLRYDLLLLREQSKILNELLAIATDSQSG